MKKLNFILKSDNNIIYDGEYLYNIDNNKIRFNVENNFFTLNYDSSNFTMKKETDDDIFTVNYVDGICDSYLYLKKYNVDTPLEIDVIDYTYGDKSLSFSYNIVSDEEVLKTIFISFVN